MCTRDVDVEEVDLAVGPDDLATRIDETRRVVKVLPVLRAPLGDAAGEEVDRVRRPEVPRPGDRGAVERLRSVADLRTGAPEIEQLGEGNERRARVDRFSDQAGRGLEIPFLLRRRTHLNGRHSHDRRPYRPGPWPSRPGLSRSPSARRQSDLCASRHRPGGWTHKGQRARGDRTAAVRGRR